ncbi:MAG TPA: TetR/AcrR family transcriptional regulator [Candidatus Limnocylindria bacterium]
MALPPNPCSKEPRWQRRPEDRPDEILAAAFEVFSEQGYARARLEDVAQRAGVSKGTLYCYFKSKDDLFRAMVRHHVVGRIAALEETIALSQATATEQIQLLLTGMWEVLYERRFASLARLVHGELTHFPEMARFYSDEVILRARRTMDRIIARGVERGEFRPVPHGFASRAIPMLLVQAAQMQSFFTDFDPDALTGDQTAAGARDILLYGLLARPEDTTR